MKSLILSLVVASLAGCSGSEIDSSRAQDQMSADDRDQVWAIRMQDKVRSKLRDPDAARFEDAKTYHGSGVPVVCGRVNGANAFGGKAGYQRFVAAGDLVVLEEDMAMGEMDKTWAQLCRP